MKEQCPNCGEKYKRLGSHWTGDCSPPKLTKQQREIIVGLLMGDGCLSRSSSKNPCLQVEMISENYLKYLDDAFGCFSTGVKLKHTAKESANNCRDSGFSPNAKKENYSDLYKLKTRHLEELLDFNWYTTGKKVWPENIELTPTVLKHWYVGDGGFNNGGTNYNIRFSLTNEMNNKDKIDKYFERVGLPSPSNYAHSIRSCSAQFTRSQSEQLWEYMGKPLPDFEYKWPEKYR